jgi:hypothetical protein
MPKLQGWVEQGGVAILSGIPSGAAGGVSIGLPVVGGTPQSVLFVDALGNLGQDNPNLTYSAATLHVPAITATGTVQAATMTSIGAVNGASLVAPTLNATGTAAVNIGNVSTGGVVLASAGGNVAIGSTVSPVSRVDITSPDNTVSTNIVSVFSNNRFVGVGIGYQDIRQLGGSGSALSINASGTGVVGIGNVSTGSVVLASAGGNVAIGSTVVPVSRLDITSVDNLFSTNIVSVLNNSRSTGIGITWQEVRQIGSSGSSLNLNASGTGLVGIGDVSTGGVVLATAGGNVGINTGTPADKLEVSGNISIPAASGGHYLYNLGNAAAANSEFLRILTQANVYFLQSSATGTGVIRDFAIPMGGVYSLYVKASSGNVTIGSNSAVSAKLTVSNASAEGFEVNPVSGSVTLQTYNRTTLAYTAANFYCSQFLLGSGPGANVNAIVVNTAGNITLGASGNNVGFFGVTPIVRPAAYTVTGATPTRTLAVATVTATTLANFVAQMILDLQAYGLLQ